MAHLTLEQRYTIQVLREEKLSQQAIANRIGKDKSVVSREIRRNADKRNGTYKAELAQRKYTERPRKSLGYLTPKEYALAKFGIVVT